MWDVVLDALIDSLKVLPILLVMYVLIELIELKGANNFKNNKFFKSKFAPLVGAGIGVIPQCGFGVVATDLYAKRNINVGTLMAIYIATSDEALPIFLLHPSAYKDMFLVLGIKVLLAIVVGYGVNLFLKYVKQPKIVKLSPNIEHGNYIGEGAMYIKNQDVQKLFIVGETQISIDEDDEFGCCGHHIHKPECKTSFKHFIYHPIVHSLKIFIFILLVNFALGTVIYFVGIDNLNNFLQSGLYLQPLVAALIGLIPNCAASVLITELFIMGGLSLGACVSGLCVNAGIAYAVLLKQNKDRKGSFSIIGVMFAISVIVGLIITLF